MDLEVSRHRSISALLVDVPAGHAAQLSRVLDEAGWTARSVPVQGPEALSAARPPASAQPSFPGVAPSRRALHPASSSGVGEGVAVAVGACVGGRVAVAVGVGGAAEQSASPVLLFCGV